MITRSEAACFVGIDLQKDTLTACVLRGTEREDALNVPLFVADGRPRLARALPKKVQALRNRDRRRNGLTR